MMKNLICERLKFHMRRTGTTTVMLAELLGKTTADVLDYQTGKQEPDMETIAKMSYILDTTTDELLVYEDIE